MIGPGQRIVVTGGSGFMGINLIRFLLARDYEVTSLDIAPFDYPERDRVTAITGDVRDPRAVRESLRDAAAVVHCAAALPLYPPDEIMSTDVDGTRNVLKAAKESGIARVVHISSTAVYGTVASGVAEDGRFEVLGPYAEAKIRAERECAIARDAGLCVPVLRPKTFVGPERLGVWAILYDWAYSGSGFPLIGRGDNRYQLLDVDDLSDVVHAVLTLDESVANDTFNVGARLFGTMREDFQAVLDHAGHGKKVRPLPVWPVVTALKVLERLRLSPVYEWVYETAMADSFVSIEKAERALGFRPRYSNREALIRNFDWYVAHLPQFRETSGISHRVPWKQGLLALGKKVF
jgi:nucleoside-diphosphate-sugar epimerase